MLVAYSFGIYDSLYKQILMFLFWPIVVVLYLLMNLFVVIMSYLIKHLNKK